MKSFIDKAYRKTLLILRRIYYHKYYYKPTGIRSCKQLSFEQSTNEGVAYTELYPAFVSKLDIPENMYKIYSPYPKHSYQADVPPAFLVEIEHGRVYHDDIDSIAIINKNNLMIGDASFQYSGKLWEMTSPEQNNVFKLKYFIDPLELKGTAFSLLAGGGVSIGNYFHWVIDALARIHLLMKAGLFESVDYFLVHNLRPDFVMDSLYLLGIRKSQVIEVDTVKHVKSDKLIVSSPVRGNDKHVPVWAIDFFRNTFLLKIKKKYKYTKLYISRNDAAARRVLNEDELLPILNKYGFKVVMLSDYSFEEKIDLFSSAEVILSPIGAQLTNLVFCKKGATLIELFPEGFVLPDSVDVAKKVGMEYHYLICKNNSPSTNIAEGRKENITVNIDKLKAVLDQIIPVSARQIRG